MRVILSGGGTGGHIYPAVAVAEELKAQFGDGVDILFVGAEGRMEMEKVPALGYNIVGLPIAGLQRKLDWRNLLLPFKVLRSICRAKRVIKEFKADIVVGFGGYASAPVLWAAGRLGVPTVIQEQNSYAGVTNKIVSRYARKICVAYDGMDRFFKSTDKEGNERIVMTGNPLRGGFSAEINNMRGEALQYFGLNESKPVVLITGGSLGTRTLNTMMQRWIEKVESMGGNAEVQVIWQSGKFYDEEMKAFLGAHPTQGVWQGAFLERMDMAYAAADVVVGRSGACTVSELCLVGKPTIFVPSPNVAEDHQTKNAMALVDKGAALMVCDNEAPAKAMALAQETLKDSATMESLKKNIAKLAQPTAAKLIVEQIVKIVDKK